MSKTKVQTNHIVDISNNLLRRIEGDGEKRNNTITRIRNKELIHDGKTQVTLDNGSVVWADTTPDPEIDSVRRNGWYYRNESLNDKMNLYFFDGANETFTLKDVRYVYAKMFIDSWGLNVQNLPFFHIYTKPTGVNDAGAWYHSRIDYTMTINTPKIGLAEECMFFGKTVPNDNEKWFSNRAIQMTNVTKNGECLDTEEILTIAIATDSSATIGGVNIGVQELGFSMTGGYNRKTELIGFINDDVLHHDHILKNTLLSSGGTNIMTKTIRIDTSHGNISWWVQSNSTVLSNQIGVDILVSHDNTLFETVALNSKFVDSLSGTYTVYGNIRDFKPTYIKLRITNNDNTTDGIFNCYLSY